MNAWKHSVSSAAFFGGSPEDYLEVHRFIDSSKLFIYDVKHRAFLHHLFGMELCEELLGPTLTNREGDRIPVREIAAQHFREDLSRRVPSLHDWFADVEDRLGQIIQLPKDLDEDLESFVMRPYLRCGLRSSMIITYSHFGVALAERLYGFAFAKRLAAALPGHHRLPILLGNYKLKHKWQWTVDQQSLVRINHQMGDYECQIGN